jgi:hypothetical protein
VDVTDSKARESGPIPRVVTSRSFATRVRELSPALQGLFALAIYLTVFIVGFGLALIGHLGVPEVGQDWQDPQIFIWSWRWWPYAVSHLLNPLYSNQVGAPGGYNMAWATTTPSVALIMGPVTAAFGPVVSFNLTLLLAPPVSAWAAFVTTRRLTGRFWAALPAGAVYGFNIYELAHEVSGQPNLTVTMLIPLMVYLVLLWWDGTLGRTGYVIWMTVAMAVEFYTFTETFTEMTVVWAVALVAGFLVAGHAARLTVIRLAGLTAIAYTGAVVLASPYLVYALRNYPAALTRQSLGYSLDLAGLILPRTDRLMGLKSLGIAANHDLSSQNYVGIPLLVILLALAVFAWWSRITRLLVITFVIVIALAAGPSLIIDGKQVFALPWGKLWSLPVARSVETNRFIVFGYLVLAIVLALWLAEPVRSRSLRAARWGLGLLAIAAIFADLPTFAEVVVPQPPTYTVPIASLRPVDALPAFITDGLYRRYLSPGETVVVISQRGNAGILFQAYTDFYFRIAGGFFNATPVDALPQPVASLSDPTKAREQEFGAYVHAAGVGAIIVEQAWSEKWMYIFGTLGMRGVSVGGVTVYPTNSGQVSS